MAIVIKTRGAQRALRNIDDPDDYVARLISLRRVVWKSSIIYLETYMSRDDIRYAVCLMKDGRTSEIEKSLSVDQLWRLSELVTEVLAGNTECMEALGMIKNPNQAGQ